MILYAKIGKFHHRDRMLARVNWTGNESVFDVGTGRGLLMIGAAMKLTTGKSVGIDIWSKNDLSGNSQEKTLHNVELESVSGRVEVRSEDATALTFPDASFDVVLSNLCIHNIPSREGRDRACREIVRVLKPGGKAIISDFKNTADYVAAFRSAGAAASRGGLDFLHTFPHCASWKWLRTRLNAWGAGTRWRHSRRSRRASLRRDSRGGCRHVGVQADCAAS